MHLHYRKTLRFIAALLAAICITAGSTLPTRAQATVTENAVVSSLSPYFLNAVANAIVLGPDGTAGRNRGSWYNVEDQRQTFRLAATGIRGRNAALIARAFLVAKVSFAHQRDDGGFSYDLQRSPLGPGKPLNGTQDASLAAFFVSDFAHALLLLQGSPWFQASATTSEERKEIPGYKEKLSKSLDYLLAHTTDLHNDKNTANRLLIYAEAYYLTGKLLDRSTALDTGRGFISAALAQQTPDGTFLELQGFDSSYQAVSLSEGQYLYLYMDGDSQQSVLRGAIDRGYTREVQALQPSGELSTRGNTRVGPESIPAQHGAPIHQVDKTAMVFAFSYYAGITGSAEAKQRAAAVLHYYFNV